MEQLRATFARMRTKIDLDTKALEAAKIKSQAEGISLDEAVSALILNGVSKKSASQERRNGVFKSKGGRYNSADVAAALER
jgi:hypothetical protein